MEPLLKNYNLTFKTSENSKKYEERMLPKVDIQSYKDLNKDCLITCFKTIKSFTVPLSPNCTQNTQWNSYSYIWSPVFMKFSLPTIQQLTYSLRHINAQRISRRIHSLFIYIYIYIIYSWRDFMFIGIWWYNVMVLEKKGIVVKYTNIIKHIYEGVVTS